MTGRLSVASLGKAYRVHPSHWARLAEWIASSRPRYEPQLALHHVSFSVATAEVVQGSETFFVGIAQLPGISARISVKS